LNDFRRKQVNVHKLEVVLLILTMSIENMSIFRNIAINIFRKNGFKSIIQATRLISNDIKALWTIINE